MYISGTDYYNSVPVGTLPVLGYFSTGSITGRKRQYEFEHNGKRYKRDISMLIPEQTMLEIDVTIFDVTDLKEAGSKPKLHSNGAELREEELIICKTELTDTEWYLAEINKIYADEIEVIYYTTPIKSIENYYIEQSIDLRYENLRNTCFRKNVDHMRRQECR
jgi:hypothetical protein